MIIQKCSHNFVFMTSCPYWRYVKYYSNAGIGIGMYSNCIMYQQKKLQRKNPGSSYLWHTLDSVVCKDIYVVYDQLSQSRTDHSMSIWIFVVVLKLARNLKPPMFLRVPVPVWSIVRYQNLNLQQVAKPAHQHRV